MTIPRTVPSGPLEYFDFATLKNGGAEHGILDPHDFTPVRRESVVVQPGAELVEVEMGFADEDPSPAAPVEEPRELSRTPDVPPSAARELLGRISRAMTGSSREPASDLTAGSPPATTADPRHPAALPVSPVLPGRRFIAGMKADQLRRDAAGAPREDTEDLYRELMARYEQRPPRRPGW